MEKNIAILLSDYEERCVDYRRQVWQYTAFVQTLGIITLSFFTTCQNYGNGKILYYLPFMTLIFNLALGIQEFTLNLCNLILNYMIEIEITINRFIRGCGRIHIVDNSDTAKIVFGFHLWKILSSKVYIKRIKSTYITACIILFITEIFILSKSINLSSKFHFIFVSFLVILTAIISFIITGKVLWESLDKRKNISNYNCNPFKVNTNIDILEQILLADFRQRTNDFRFFANFYVFCLLGVVGCITTSIVLLLSGGSDLALIDNYNFFFILEIPHDVFIRKGILFVIGPIILLLYALVAVTVFRKNIKLKIYLEEIESYIDTNLFKNKEVYTHCNGKFDVGFFSKIRRKSVHKIGTHNIPLYSLVHISIIFIVAISFFIMASIHGGKWLYEIGLSSVPFYCFLGLGTVFLIWLWYSAKKIGVKYYK